MATYKVQTNQNLFDVALTLYGSIEGLFDILISNPDINMNTELVPGMELEYHDYFLINDSIVNNMRDQQIIPGNGERSVYMKRPTGDLRFIVHVDTESPMIVMQVGGEGDMIIDWGDNTELETVILSHSNAHVEHYFNSAVDKRRVKVYGNFSLTYLDTSELHGNLYLMRPLTVDEFYSTANGYSLDGLFLFNGTYKVSLPACTVTSLLPLGDMSLMELDLTKVRFMNDNAIDEYLDYIVHNYGSRRNCKVILDKTPGSIGKAAMNTILGEPEWNNNGPWEFIIDGIKYTKG